MAVGEASIRIDRPAEEVFPFVADPENNPLWRKGVTRSAWLDPGPMRIGRRGTQTRRLLGREWTVVAEIAEWDPPRRAAWRTVSGPVTVTSWVRVEPDGDGCVVTGGADGGFTGPIGGLLDRAAVPRMIRQAYADLEGLKRRFEETPETGPG